MRVNNAYSGFDRAGDGDVGVTGAVSVWFKVENAGASHARLIEKVKGSG